MQAEAFVKQLADAAPPASDLEKCGLSSEQAREFITSFHCVKRDRPLPKPNGSDPVLKLLRNWDLSKVEIGMVRFPDPPVQQSGKICVGCVEVDPLVILPGSGEIVVHEFGTKEHLLWRVAKNGGALLDALLIAAQFLEKTGIGTIDYRDSRIARPVALECASAAGGDRYLDFYKMLLGAE
jgi:hypothetical protein